MRKDSGSSGTRPIDVIRRCSSSVKRSITIPEWEDLTLYFGKITIADWEGVEAREPKSDMERNIYLLISMAKLENGTPAFATGDKMFLTNEADFTVLQRVINFMFQSVYESVQEAERAVEENPTLGSG